MAFATLTMSSFATPLLIALETFFFPRDIEKNVPEQISWHLAPLLMPKWIALSSFGGIESWRSCHAVEKYFTHQLYPEEVLTLVRARRFS